MQVSARLHHPVLPLNGMRSHLVVSVTADAASSELRPPVAIIPVIDRSGSMASGRKLDIVTAALDHLAGLVGADDMVGLVTFDTTVECLMAPAPATSAGVTEFRRHLSSLRPRASTALFDAVCAGVDLAQRIPPGTAVRVLVLTDGRANHGPTDAESFTPIVADLPSHVSVSTIGVGADCDHDLLAALAEAGSGSYGFVESNLDAASVIGADVGSLLSAAAAEVEVTIAARQWGTLEPLATSARTDADGNVTVRLGTMGADVTRNVVVAFDSAPPSKQHARRVTVADVTVTGVVDDEPVTITELPKVWFRDSDPDDFASDDDLDELVDRARLSASQAQAERAARVGDFAGAQSALSSVQFVSSQIGDLRDQLLVNYDDAHQYAAQSSVRASASSMLSQTASLSGSSAAFDVLASRTIGEYTTQAQRSYASQVRGAVSERLAQGQSASGAAEPALGDLGARTGPADRTLFWSGGGPGDHQSGSLSATLRGPDLLGARAAGEDPDEPEDGDGEPAGVPRRPSGDKPGSGAVEAGGVS